MKPLRHNESYMREQMLKHKYGLTVDLVKRILYVQRYNCRICLRPIGEMGKHHVDHNHKTGRVRGLLCSNCNTGLGMFQDNKRILAAAIIYLEDDGKYLYGPE